MFWEIAIDVFICLLIVAGTFFGSKRGFFLTATRPIKWFASIILAFTLSGIVASSIVQPIIEAPITNQISEYLTDKCDNITPDNLDEKLPTLLKLAAGLADVDIESIEGNTTAEFVSQTVEKLASPVIYLISVIISFIAVYFISKILLKILLKILNNVFDSGVLGIFNKVLGAVIGALFAFVIAWIFVTLFGYMISIPSLSDTDFVKAFDGGHIYNFIKRMSPLDLLLSF